MKKFTPKRILSVLLAIAVVAGSTGTALAGGDTMPPREGEQGYLGENQPTYHGHRAYDVLNWTPETDEYAQFMQANVPLQERNEAFSATQANPRLDQKVKSLALTEDYGNEFFNPTQYNDDFAQYAFNFWQYLDYRAAWHGVVTDPTPDSLFDPEAGWWERNYEFGVVNIPNPAYTNAAHKNGVMSLGCIFFPRAEHTDDWVFQNEDGSFPMADKLVEMAKWYGFDGYFINAEEALPSSFLPVYEEFCRAMTSQGIYVQVYASNLYGQSNESSWGRIDYYNKTAENFSNWIKDPDDETIAANSLYMNPDPSKSHVDGSVRIMESLGLDAKETVFNTLEAGQTGFQGQRGTLYNLYDENLVPRTAIANLGAGTVWAHLDEQLFGHEGNNSYDENRRGDASYQKYVIARERAWWAGSLDAPTYAGGKGTLESASLSHGELLDAVLNATFDPVAVANNPDRGSANPGASYQSWRGISAFISERSVINGTNFYTSFNTGHGMQYFVDGKVSNDNEWSNINVQDILPTWQWWIDTDSENRLTLDFDYGTEYNAGYEYEQLGGYEGSSSLAIFGTVDAKSDIRLYKTELAVGENTKLNLTYNKPSKTDDSTFSLVLYLMDGENVKTVYVPIKNANRATKGWVKTTLDLSAYAGEPIAAFGFSVNTNGRAIANSQMNLGEGNITDGSLPAPKAPTGLKVDRKFDTGEVYLSWDLADYEEVRKYNVYAVYADGTETYVGGAYDDNYYVKDTIYDANRTVSFKVTAVGEDGRQSAPAAVATGTGITGLTVTEAPGVLSVSWNAPAMECASVRADVVLPDSYAGNTDTYSSVFDASATSGQVSIPVVDGSRYTLRLTYLDAQGSTLAYADHTGFLLDLFCDDYAGGLEARVISSGWKLLNPHVYDWWHLYAWQSNGQPITFSNKAFAIRGVDDLTGMPVSGDFGYIEVQLEDFAGNLSEKTRVYWGAETKAVDKTVFPDAALLAAVQEQVGTTMDQVLAFDGTLDLSNTEVTDLTGIAYLENLTGIDLSGSSIEKITGLSGLANLREISITDCAKLQILDLSNTTVERITCADAQKLDSLVCVMLEHAQFDLTEGTPEQIFVEAAQTLTADKEDIFSADAEETNLALAGTVVSGNGQLFDGDEENYLAVTDGEEFVIDLGSRQSVERWELVNYNSLWKLDGFTLYASDDNENFTEVLAKTSIDVDENGVVSEALETPVTARYFKIKVATANTNYIKEFKLFGHASVSFPAGVTWEGQRPAAYFTVPEAVSYDNSEDVLDLAGLATYTTTRGTAFASLKEAGFIAEGYDIDAQMNGGYDVIYVDGDVSQELPLDTTAVYLVSYVKFGQENTIYETVVSVGDAAYDEAYAKLEALVQTAKETDRDPYTDESLQALDEALAAAEEALENGETEELLAAWEKLEKALQNLAVKPHEHTWGDWTVTKEADCFHDGLKTRTCTGCGETEVTIIPANSENCPSKSFTDLDAKRWYHQGVDYALSHGIMEGMSGSLFQPDGILTRGQLVTMLYRMAESPAVEGKTPFTDVAEGSFYTEAVAWAYSNGIVKGMTATTFAPNASVTREQLVTFLYRYAKLQGEDVTVTGELKGYTDTDKLGDFAMEAMTWAVENEIINGMGGGKLAPKDTATRAQFATVLMRFLDKN